MKHVEEDYAHRYRIDLAWYEYNALVDLVNEALKNEIYVSAHLMEKIENHKKIKISYAKIDAVSKASKKRVKEAKSRFESAVSELSKKGIELTAYKIAKEAKISFATAKKYLKQFNEGEYKYANDE